MIMYLLDKQQNIIKAISEGILEAKMTEEINAADKLVFSLVQSMRLPSDIYYICIPATRGNAFLMFKIISEKVNDDRIEYTCIESAYDELKSYTYLKDVRPQDKTAGEMLNIALAGTRWEVGHVEETPRNQTNFYYISTLEALQKIVELFKVELTFSIVIDPIRNRIVRRQVNLYNQQGERTGKRFEYGSNLLSVTREESSENLVTALVGRGKGEQVSEGQDGGPDGYGRRIMFTDVIWSKANGNPTDKPAGQDYVEDKEATHLYGFDDGKPRIGITVFEDIEDVNQLINATWAALQVAKRPKVSFKASALDVGDLGLGDTVAIIRHELNIEYFTRVYKVEHDLLDKNNNVIELGDDFSEKSLTSYVASVQQAQNETAKIADIALTSANGKNKNFYSKTKPAIAAEGDNLFLDLGNGETEHYIWHSGNWELISSTLEMDKVKEQIEFMKKDLDNTRSLADAMIDQSNLAYEQAVEGLEKAKKSSEQVERLDENVRNAVDSANDISKKYASLREELLSSDKNNYDALMAEVNKTKKPIADLSASLEGVSAKYASLDGRVGQISAGLNGLELQFNTSKEQLTQLKLDAQGLQAGLSDTNGNLAKLQVKANSIEQQMLGKVGNETFESFKSSTARELKEKLTATDLNGYAKTTELVKTAEGLRASVTSVEGKISDFDIQNLVYNSEFHNNLEGWVKSNVYLSENNINFTDNEWDIWKGSPGVALRNTTTANGYLAFTSKRVKLTGYEKLSASVQLHVTDNVTNGNNKARMELAFFSTETGGGYVSSSDKSTQEARNISNGYQQLLYCDDVAVPSGAKYVAIRLISSGIGNFIFNQPMMTVSSKHVPYKQDQKMLDSLQGQYSELLVGIDGIKATVANKSDKSYVDQEANKIRTLVSSKADTSYVDQTANHINSVVAGKADISLVNQKANEWQLQLAGLAIGGTNLLAKTNSEMEVILAPTVGYQEGVRYNTTKNIDQDMYTLSFEAKAYYSGQKIVNYFWYGDLGGNNTVEHVIESNGVERTNPLDGFWEVTLTNSWRRYWITYKVRPEEFKKSVIVGRRFVGSSPKPKGSVFIRNVKLEVGNKPTDWAPAPEDTLVAITAVRNDLNEAINLRVQKKDLISQINLQAGHTLIQSNKIYLDADSVVFSGKAFIPDAAIANINADKIHTGVLNAAKVSIINLDVNNLTGNKTEFVKSFWRSAYGNYVNIDYSGMRVTYGNTTTKFDSSGMTINAVGESIGGIGWQGMKGMPSNYQGLTFWLDGGGDYMAWAARDNGNYNMNPLIKMAWYRNEWRPNDTNLGFNFNDPVTLNNLIYPSGKTTDGMALRFFTTRYNGHVYPTIGSASTKSGIMFGDWDLFLIFNDKVYPLQGWKIPVNLDQGRVSSYQKIEY